MIPGGEEVLPFEENMQKPHAKPSHQNIPALRVPSERLRGAVPKNLRAGATRALEPPPSPTSPTLVHLLAPFLAILVV